jgi:hypothetical protein
MGNGPGNIKEYVDAFYQYPSLQGGFAWEWANHGLLTKDKNTGEEFMAYGGDFGEEVHDATFVMDGEYLVLAGAVCILKNHRLGQFRSHAQRRTARVQEGNRASTVGRVNQVKSQVHQQI